MTLVNRAKTILLTLPPLFVALLPALGGVLLWCVVGVINIESGLHIEYSLGSSSGWHSWFDRGNPGEVVRRWGVPVYDQWSGLGYRLPTQGLLTDTPLSYLSMVLPINSVVTVAWLASLWFMFSLVHRWVGSWVGSRRVAWCVLVDSALLGLMSFYTLWHGWQTYVVQVAGAVVCVVCVTSREVVEDPERVPVLPLTASLSAGTLMLMMPHLGYGMTYAPAIALLFAVVVCARRGVLARRIARRPASFVAPLLALLALAPGLLDFAREQRLQAARASYQTELGVLDRMLAAGNLDVTSLSSWLFNALPLLHTFTFPLLALVRPTALSWSVAPAELRLSWRAYSWPFETTQFHGGVLLLLLVVWSFVRPRLSRGVVLERVVALFALSALLLALLNTDAEALGWLSLEWVPVWLLSNSRWQYSDVSFLLMLALLVWRADDLCDLFSSVVGRAGVSAARWAGRLLVAFGVLVVACVLPYRVADPVRLNGGQTRFAPLQFDGETRESNEQWRTVLASLRRDGLGVDVSSPQRVLIEGEGMMGAEGDNSWWGLRTHSQLRDVKLASLLSWPRIRSGETLTPGDTFQHIVSDPVCDGSLPARLDVLAVQWAILPTECVTKHFPSAPRVSIPLSPDWKSFSSGRERTNAMQQMFASASSVDFSATRLQVFHHWWAYPRQSKLAPCGLLTPTDKNTDNCINHLGLFAGQRIASIPLKICEGSCMATYRLEQRPPAQAMLVIPLKYDEVIRAHQEDKQLLIADLAGLVAIPASQLSEGVIRFSVAPDGIMKLRAIAPLAVLVLCLLVIFSRRDAAMASSGFSPR